MSRVPSNVLISLSRQCYATEAAQGTAAAAVSTTRRAVAAVIERKSGINKTAAAKEEIFWMRDPKTGYWLPENRFEEIDVADLRAQLLGKK